MRSGFYNSDITGYDSNNLPIYDRAEDAEFFAKFFKSFFKNGVYPNPSTNFQVISHSGMTVKVLPGLGFIEGYFAWEDTERVLSIQASHTGLDRIDRVVLRLNLATRAIDLYIVTGTPSLTPTAPQLNRPIVVGDIYELGLATLFVTKNVTTITQERITDTRMDVATCGLVTHTIGQIDTTTIFNQLQNQVSNNIATIQSAIDGTTAGLIQSKMIVDGNSITIPPTATWTELTLSTATTLEKTADPDLVYKYRTTVNYTGIKDTDTIELIPNVKSAVYGLSSICQTANGTISIYANNNLNGKEVKFIKTMKRKVNE